jgi:hypothetical protein
MRLKLLRTTALNRCVVKTFDSTLSQTEIAFANCTEKDTLLTSKNNFIYSVECFRHRDYIASCVF